MTSASFISVSSPPIRFYFLTAKYFQIIYFICFSIVWQSPVSRYHSLSHSPPQQIFGSYFLVFGKCGVTPHRLYCGSLTLTIESAFYMKLKYIRQTSFWNTLSSFYKQPVYKPSDGKWLFNFQGATAFTKQK